MISPRLLTAASLAVGLSATTACSSGSVADEVELSISVAIPESVELAQPWKAFAQHLSDESGGRIKADMYWASSLVAWPETLPGLSSGLADVAVTAPVMWPSDWPAALWATPMVDIAESTSPTVGPGVAAKGLDAVMQDDVFQADFDKSNVEYLAGFSYFGYALFCKDEVASVEDAKGLKVRSPGGIYAAEIEAMGMTPVTVPSSESYEALQRGVIDCDAQTPASVVDYGIQEVAKHVVWVNLSPAVGYLMMNKDQYDGLSADLQDVVRNAATEFAIDMTVSQYERVVKDFSNGGEASGLTSSTIPELSDLLHAQKAKLIEGLLDGTNGVVEEGDAARVVDLYRESVAKGTAGLADAGFETSDVEGDVLDRYLADGSPESLEALRNFLTESLGKGAS